jgi:hypothetical protein
MPKEDDPSLLLRSAGRECGAVALQWYFRVEGDRWADRCEIAMSVALRGLRQSKLSQREIDEWTAGFREGLGNLPGADGILKAA